MFKAQQAMTGESLSKPLDQLWQEVVDSYAISEEDCLQELLPVAQPEPAELAEITRKTTKLIEQVRQQDDSVHMLDALLQEYSLDTQEGILLMCLAEALMRIPDKKTAEALIADRLSGADWEKHMGKSDSTLVNASTWGLLLTGKVIKLDQSVDERPAGILSRLVKQSGEPVIRAAMNQAMKIMGKQFVLGRDIREALDNARKYREQGYTYSFDMLGEAALTQVDAKRYFDAYMRAIEALAKDPHSHPGAVARGVAIPGATTPGATTPGATTPGATTPGASTISVKLSALHPRYEQAQAGRVLTELYGALVRLLTFAREKNVGFTIDAEEMDRLELSLKLFEKLYRSGFNKGWGQLGFVVQTYSKRALPVLVWLTALAKEHGEPIPVRLVKGAYWDSEIKICQQRGLKSYPVFTRKEATDVSFLACMKYLFTEQTADKIYPQFASHNAHATASILHCASQSTRQFEFQRLHGMGDALYKTIIEQHQCPVRIYAPVGAHKDLLPYLVRRLLENGANSSFVHRLVDAATPVSSLVNHPADDLKKYNTWVNDRIPLPPALFSDRVNSAGFNLLVESDFKRLNQAIGSWDQHRWFSAPVIAGPQITAAGEVLDLPGQADQSESLICSPHDQSKTTGTVKWASNDQINQALTVAGKAFTGWNNTPVVERARILDAFANNMEANFAELMALCCREAGKTLQDSIDEIREAVDFCRYYAQQARTEFASPRLMPGPTGETNELYVEGRGVLVCISPWNFPLAIFTGQIAAALVSGNTVIAKPAEQTSLIASRAIELLYDAGLPKSALQFLPGEGAKVGPTLLSDPRVSGVVFTGSTQTAHVINRTLAARDGAIGLLIAETGGQNAMIVDSTALPEQVVKDVMHSAFASAGQRCSALRVLFVQDDIAEHIKQLLSGAMQELVVGNPAQLSTDIGPVIDATARDKLKQHIKKLSETARWQCHTPLPEEASKGFFIAPCAFEIDDIGQLTEEHFGPVLHIVRYSASKLDHVIDSINAAGYGLTLGVHSRNESNALYIERKVKTGNTYINRNQIGAVVGVQPFGGRGLSGTGPKAGGPYYLHRFISERTRTTNTTAVGGNATLLSLGVEQL